MIWGGCWSVCTYIHCVVADYKGLLSLVNLACSGGTAGLLLQPRPQRNRMLPPGTRHRKTDHDSMCASYDCVLSIKEPTLLMYPALIWAKQALKERNKPVADSLRMLLTP